MSRRLIDFASGKPLLDIASYARRGPGRRDRLSQGEIELIERTVRRTPEVMVKVLSRGGQDLKSVARHLAYLNRGGDVEIETDDGQRLSGKGVEKELLDDWDLDLEQRRTGGTEYWSRRNPPKPVHKLMFSMPAGTPPNRVLSAVKNFAREEFGLKHRYAMVLHTDEPHPHVHMVVKAVSEQGERLNIRKATLREWRREFARHLRALGIPANATERAVRGQVTPPTLDGIYRAACRGESAFLRDRLLALTKGNVGARLGVARLSDTRHAVADGWTAVADHLAQEGRVGLSLLARSFLHEMAPVATQNEQLLARRQATSARTIGDPFR